MQGTGVPRGQTLHIIQRIRKIKHTHCTCAMGFREYASCQRGAIQGVYDFLMEEALIYIIRIYSDGGGAHLHHTYLCLMHSIISFT